MTAVDTTDLTAAEADLLASAEKVIDRGLTTFIEVGDALATVRDNRLYRTTFPTFEAYCQQRWGFSDSRARQLIGAAQTVTNVTALGLPAPANEGQARALAAVPEDQRAEVWAETLDRTGGKPTATAVAETVKGRTLWVCAGCGEVSHRFKAPANCPTCRCPAHGDLVRDLVPLPAAAAPDKQLVFVSLRVERVLHHQVRPTGTKTTCGWDTVRGHVLPVGVLVEKYSSTPCGSCWPPAAPADADRRWECRECAHTFTAPAAFAAGNPKLTARCPQCRGWQTTDLGPDEPDDVDDAEHPADTAWHCDSCGRTRVQRPGACPTCGAKTGFVAPGPTAHDIDPDGRCLTCGPPGNPRERVYTAWLRDGQDYHRLTNGGKHTVCGAQTGNGHITALGQLIKDYTVKPCEYSCWPAAPVEAEAFDGVHRGFRSWGSGPNGAGTRCTCGTVLDGFATVAEASMVMDRHVAEGNAATDEPDDEPTAPAEAKHCEKCGTPLIPDDAALGMLRCDDCDDQGDHLSIDGGPCQVCAPDDHAAEKVWMAADRYGLAYHRLPVENRTGCDRPINSGRVMTRGEAAGQIGGKPCRPCWPNGDAPTAAPAAPVLEGEVVTTEEEPAAPAVEALPAPAPFRTGELDTAECKALELQFIRGDWLREFTTDFDAARDKCSASRPGQRQVSDWPQSDLVTDFTPDGVSFRGGGYRPEGLITWDRVADSMDRLRTRAPHVHFQTLIDACDAFDTAIQDVDTDLAVEGFKVHQASKITQAIALGQWLSEYMELVEEKLKPVAPAVPNASVVKTDGQLPGQTDLLEEVRDGADR